MTIRTRSQRTESSADVSHGDHPPSRLLKSSRKRKMATSFPCSAAVGRNTTVDDEEEPVEKLLEGFAKKSLVLLAKEAVSLYPDLIESVRKLAVTNPALRKIVVTNLSENITAKTIASVFREFGEIQDYYISVPSSYLSRGSAYILFKRRSGARKALKEPLKVIDNKLTYCMLASLQSVTCRSPLNISEFPPGNQPPLLEQEEVEEEEEEEPVEKLLEAFGVEYLLFFNKEAVSKYPNLIKTVHGLADVDPKLRRVFVFRLVEFTTVKTLESFFGQFGEIEEIEGIRDYVDKSHSGFILFKNRHGARELLKQTERNADFGTNGSISISPSTIEVDRALNSEMICAPTSRVGKMYRSARRAVSGHRTADPSRPIILKKKTEGAYARINGIRGV